MGEIWAKEGVKLDLSILGIPFVAYLRAAVDLETGRLGLGLSASGSSYKLLRACLDPKYFPKFHYAKRRFPIISKCRHMYGVLNVDEIKN
jgi:hypothetical protein